ncbi:hypothetical protein, partial [Peribacillus muralis]|uniref:hypothetical protein n=1 Tax=Peribacillus muralis TaxID=264697 RepID=UPI00366CE406
MSNWNCILAFTQIGMKRKATTLLREMRVYVRHHRLKAEEAHGPPLDKRAPAVQWSGHFPTSKNCGQLKWQISFHTKWNATEGGDTPAGNACLRETPQAQSAEE